MADALVAQGIEHVFAVPGESYLDVLDGLYAVQDRVRLYTCRFEAGAVHMAEAYGKLTGKPGVAIVTRGPGACHAAIGVHVAFQDSTPLVLLVGQIPFEETDRESFQEVDYRKMFAPLAKWVTQIDDAARIPELMAHAFDVARSGRPGPVLIDLPFDVQMAEIEFDDETYSPLPVYKPTATRKQVEKALEMLNAAERPLIVAGGGVINADASELLVSFAEAVNVPVVPTLMAWGAIPDDHALMAGMVGLQTSHRYANATMLESDFVLGIGNRWANRHTGSIETYTKGRKFVHVDIEPTQIGRVFNPDLGIVSDAKAALELFVSVAREWRKSGRLRDRQAWPAACRDRKRSMLRKSHFDNIPIKPQRVYEEMNKAFGRDTCYVTVIGLSQIAGAQFLNVYRPRNWINAGQAGPLGWTLPAALGVRAADPDRDIVALSGDYDFQFLIEELAVGAQFNLPYIHVVVNNSYLGLIRQAQRGFDMDYHVQLSFENINAPEIGAYGVDHVAVAEGLGCKAIRVTDPNDAQAAFATARELMVKHRVPVVVEFILERVTNIAMGTEIDNIVEFEEVLDLPLDDVPSAQRTGTLLPA